MEIRTPSMILIVHPNNIVEVSFPNEGEAMDALEEAKKNVPLLQKAMVGKDRGLLVHVPSLYNSKEALQYYASNETGELAVALMISSFGARVMGNVILGFYNHIVPRKYPIKLFTDQAKAEAWLLQELAAIKGR